MGSAKNHELMEETAEMFECYKRVTDSASFANVPKEIRVIVHRYFEPLSE